MFAQAKYFEGDRAGHPPGGTEAAQGNKEVGACSIWTTRSYSPRDAVVSERDGTRHAHRGSPWSGAGAPEAFVAEEPLQASSRAAMAGRDLHRASGPRPGRAAQPAQAEPGGLFIVQRPQGQRLRCRVPRGDTYGRFKSQALAERLSAAYNRPVGWRARFTGIPVLREDSEIRGTGRGPTTGFDTGDWDGHRPWRPGQQQDPGLPSFGKGLIIG